MMFYEIKLEGIPKILFACSVEIENYHNRFDNFANFLELSVIEKGRMLITNDDQTCTIMSPGTLSAIFQDDSFTTSAYRNEKQCHTTVGVSVSYTATRKNSADITDIPSFCEYVLEQNLVLIPYQIELGDEMKHVKTALKKIATYYTSSRPSDWLVAVSQWLLLLEMLTNLTVKRLKGIKKTVSPSAERYIKSAEKYIADNLQGDLSVAVIAKYIGLSEGYLHRIFREQLGMGVTQYINRYRVAVAEQLVIGRGLTLKEAAVQVGVEDPFYMSRLWKKVTGSSFRESRQR